MISEWPASPAADPRRLPPISSVALVVAAATLVATLLLGGCGYGNGPTSTGSGASSASTSPKVTEITFVTPGAGPAFGFLSVGQAEGIFAKYGLKVSAQNVQAQGQIPGLVSGKFQAIAQVGMAERAALQGQPIVSIMAVGTSAPIGLVVSKEIRSLNDLKGQTIATAAASSSPYLQIRKLLNEKGLANDVKLLPITTQDARSTLFIGGQTNAMLTTFDLAVKAATHRQGAHMLLGPSDFPADGANIGLSVTADFLQKNPNTVRALIAAIYESTKFILDNPERTQKIYADAFGMTPEEAKTVYVATQPLVVLQAAPSDRAFEANASDDSLALARAIAADEVKTVWNTTLASSVFAELDCPKVCARR